MSVPDTLLADLAILTEALQADEPDLSGLLEQLLQVGQAAVPACGGLSITIASHGQPVTFTLLDEHVDAADVTTSLLLPLPLFTSTEPGSRLVLFGVRPGAFVDLAADLSQATALPLIQFSLDGHVELAATEGAPTGLTELRTVNQAIGVLIAQGLTLEEAVRRLHELSAARGTRLYAVAARIVADLERG